MKCMYCGTASINEPMFVVHQVINRKRSKIGNCCERCEANGRPLKLEIKPR